MAKNSNRRVPMRAINVFDDESWRAAWTQAFYADYLAELEHDCMAQLKRRGNMLSAKESEDLAWLRDRIEQVDQNWNDDLAYALQTHLDA